MPRVTVSCVPRVSQREGSLHKLHSNLIEIIIKNKVYGYPKLSKILWILSLLNRGGVWKRRTLNAGGSMVGRWARRWTPGFHGPRLRALSFTRSTFVGGWCLANHAVLRSHVVNKRLSQVQSAVSIDMGLHVDGPTSPTMVSGNLMQLPHNFVLRPNLLYNYTSLWLKKIEMGWNIKRVVWCSKKPMNQKQGWQRPVRHVVPLKSQPVPFIQNKYYFYFIKNKSNEPKQGRLDVIIRYTYPSCPFNLNNNNNFKNYFNF